MEIVPEWSPVELEFARELVAQVGSAIAHATLYQELEKARAEAVALSQLKTQFLANTSHELRHSPQRHHWLSEIADGRYGR